MSKVECYNCGYIGYPFDTMNESRTKKLKGNNWICNDCKELGVDK